MFTKPALEVETQHALPILSDEDREMLDAWKALSQSVEIPRFGMGL